VADNEVTWLIHRLVAGGVKLANASDFLEVRLRNITRI